MSEQTLRLRNKEGRTVAFLDHHPEQRVFPWSLWRVTTNRRGEETIGGCDVFKRKPEAIEFAKRVLKGREP
jgi:hypothetical protein